MIIVAPDKFQHSNEKNRSNTISNVNQNLRIIYSPVQQNKFNRSNIIDRHCKPETTRTNKSNKIQAKVA